jgi:hypothetical protein
MKKNIIVALVGVLVIAAIAAAAILYQLPTDGGEITTPPPVPQPQPIPKPVPPPQTCGSVSSCSNGKICPAGYECSGLPAYGCYPPGCPTPICLSSSAMISTPQGEVRVTNIHEGMIVWSLDKNGNRVSERVVRVSRTEVPADHHVVDLVLSDGRELQVSPGHPTTNGKTVGDLNPGDAYDSAFVEKADLVQYGDEATYDILPAGDTGYYFANQILLGSTLQ